MAPRFFVPASTSPTRTGDDSRLVHVVTVLELNAPHRAPQELVVGFDPSGRLSVATLVATHGMFDTARAELAFDEVTRARPHRAIAARELWLFELEVAEHLSAPETLNDPAYLYGTLYGPVSGMSGQPLPAKLGQLATTRGELFDGFAQCEPHGFRYAPPHPRSFSPLIAGDEESVVLVVPQVPEEIRDGAAANEPVVRHLLSVLIDDFNRDLSQKKRSLLSRLLVAPPELTLPKTPSTEQLFEASRRALSHLEGWPLERVKKLHVSVSSKTGKNAQAAQPANVPTWTKPSTPQLPRGDGTPRWMDDFLEAHRGAGAKLVAAKSKADDWRSDFAHGVAAPEPSAKPAPSPAGAKPDWMKDFE